MWRYECKVWYEECPNGQAFHADTMAQIRRILRGLLPNVRALRIARASTGRILRMVLRDEIRGFASR